MCFIKARCWRHHVCCLETRRIEIELSLKGQEVVMKFPFFRRKKSKYELVRDAIFDRVHDALEYVPVERLEHLKEALSDTAQQGSTKAARGATQALSAAGDALHSVAATASGVKEQLGEAATG